MKFIPSIVGQHAEEAALLWIRRDRAVADPRFRVKDLAKLDNQLQAHLDGLRIAETSAADAAWDVCENELQWEEPGELFATAVLALESARADRIERVLNLARKSYELSRPMVSALGWLPHDPTRDLIRTFVDHEDLVLRRIGIAAAAVHRQDLSDVLIESFEQPDALLSARALRAAGELGRIDLLTALRDRITSPNGSCGVWAAWSVALLAGDVQAVELLRTTTEMKGTYSGHALQMALRRTEVTEAKDWVLRLAEDSTLDRLAVIGAGVVGDPELIDWLIEIMQRPPLARVAADAFAMITGVDIAFQRLDGKPPADFTAGPTEDPEDENVAMDPDENLPWPDPVKLHDWWRNHRDDFADGSRYLVGKPITVDWLEEVLRQGFQPQRAAAALELAIRRPGQPLFEVRAPGFRQEQMLGVK